MKKIIIATDAWYPQVNGVVKCAEAIKKQLEKNDFKVILLQPELFKSVPFILYPEIKFAIFPRRKIRKIIKEENPDYIHIMTEGPIAFATRSICLKDKINFTTSVHTNFHIYFKHYFKFDGETITYASLRKFHNASSGTMAITEDLKKMLEERGLKHVLLWPLGVDTDLFKKNIKKSPEDYGFKSPVFTYFGRVAKEKNLEEFLKLDLPGTKLIIGDGPARKDLEQKYGKKAVFVGYKKGQDLVDMLSVSNVYVMPSLTDAFPLAIIEAFACGLPVACHDVLNLNKLVVKDVGFLSDNLKEAALKCLDVLPEKCREYALKFSWEESVKHFIKNLVKTR